MARSTIRTRARLAAFAALLAAPSLAAQEAPSPAEVLGYDLGERFTPYAGVQRYARALADASPRVEYRLSDWGQQLCPALDGLLQWLQKRPGDEAAR